MDDPIPLDELITIGTELRDGHHSKANIIIISVMAIVSLISSSVLIWMIKRSHASLSTTYHRILLGMSLADILYSFSLANFNMVAPSDVNYFVWNARGNQASCSTQGFILCVGAVSGLLYSVSLNLYSLAVVKYGKLDWYIRTKIEPFLHAIPIATALIISITLLVKENYNSNGGTCYIPVYDPPHCMGYEDGQIREGFEIPCGRGRDGAVIFYYLSLFITLFMVPLINGISIGMIYRDVLQQEKKIARYGASAFTASMQQSSASDADEGVNHSSWVARRISSIISSFKNWRSVVQSSSTSNQNQSNSRLVLNRALAYSMAYFLTWSFFIIGQCFEIANVNWPHFIWYLTSIFNSLQGFFNFLIFVYPKVKSAKSRGGENVTWCQAFATALRSRGIDRTTGRRSRGRPPNTNRAQRAPLEGEEKDQPKMRIFSTPMRAPEAEEEKNEIQAPVETTDDVPEPVEVEDAILELKSPQTANIVQQIEQQESNSKDSDEGFNDFLKFLKN